MRHIRQHNDFDCGLAVAAMVCGTTWDKAAEADKEGEVFDGLTTKEFLALCSRLGARVGMVHCSGKQHLENSIPPENCCAILVRRFGDKVGHYVAFDGKFVYDPGNKRKAYWTAYKNRRWKLCRWFVYC